MVKDLINPKLEFEYKKLPKDDPKQRKPNINLAKEELYWEPKIGLDKGLDLTIDFFKSELNF